LHLPRSRAHELAEGAGESSAAVAARVELAVERLEAGPFPFSPKAESLLSRAVDTLPLSARGRARVARVSVTLAALAAAPAVAPDHVGEALSYRSPAELQVAA